MHALQVPTGAVAGLATAPLRSCVRAAARTATGVATCARLASAALPSVPWTVQHVVVVRVFVCSPRLSLGGVHYCLALSASDVFWFSKPSGTLS